MHAGFDTTGFIEASVSWDRKVFVEKAPVNVSAVGMNLSPLLVSAVRMTGDGAVQTYLDDTAIRQPIALLPSGFYGTVFTGITFHSVATGVQLNFTLSYPGGQQYSTDVTLNSMSPPQPYARMGLGFHRYTPTFAGMQVRSAAVHACSRSAEHLLAQPGQPASQQHAARWQHRAVAVPGLRRRGRVGCTAKHLVRRRRRSAAQGVVFGERLHD